MCDEQLATLRVVPFEPLRPDLPIRLTFRPSAAGGSLVAQYRNDTVRHLTLAVSLGNPTTGASSRFNLTVVPGGVTEHGWAEGWSYRSGDMVDVAHADYEPQHLAVP